jgi:hypothetical protein
MTGVLPCLIPAEAEPRTPPGRLGDPLLAVYLEFVAAPQSQVPNAQVSHTLGACTATRP